MSDDFMIKKDRRIKIGEIRRKTSCYFCNLKFPNYHKVTLKQKVRYYCDECYNDLIERLRKEKQTGKS